MTDPLEALESLVERMRDVAGSYMDTGAKCLRVFVHELEPIIQQLREERDKRED